MSQYRPHSPSSSPSPPLTPPPPGISSMAQSDLVALFERIMRDEVDFPVVALPPVSPVVVPPASPVVASPAHSIASMRWRAERALAMVHAVRRLCEKDLSPGASPERGELTPATLACCEKLARWESDLSNIIEMERELSELRYENLQLVLAHQQTLIELGDKHIRKFQERMDESRS
ncbi:hypothetical protein EXIGLDRAFT_693226 [Exidia glandulosa HHB12029]|uniref:Uncharacterized protein n=1 Tax=Exidia glandulosa HHB12029 TaxID=1314781 RepID=A0A165HFT3_EXIGL|nr:hypothetical protein EXIGLDRAFT_693226 [Exidia glandulosa HHB12029]